jgi:hypothetical protein
MGASKHLFSRLNLVHGVRPVWFIFRQFDEVRRNAKFIAVKIVPSTRSRGITPGPKLAASPIIHNRMASVKIVQNTALLLRAVALKILRFGLRLCGPKDLTGRGLRFGQIIFLGQISGLLF